MRHSIIGAFVAALCMVAPAVADMSSMLAPIGDPQFTESITQSGWAPVTVASQYIGVRVVAPVGAFIENVTGLASAVSGSQQYKNGRLVEAWWTNASPSSFSATYELVSLLGQPAAEDPESYVGLASRSRQPARMAGSPLPPLGYSPTGRTRQRYWERAATGFRFPSTVGISPIWQRALPTGTVVAFSEAVRVRPRCRRRALFCWASSVSG